LRIKFYPSLQIKFHIRAEEILSSSPGKIPLSPLCILTARAPRSTCRAVPHAKRAQIKSSKYLKFNRQARLGGAMRRSAMKFKR